MSSPFLVVLLLVAGSALGCVVLAASALSVERTRESWWLLAISVANLALVPYLGCLLGPLLNIAIHGFDLPT